MNKRKIIIAIIFAIIAIVGALIYQIYTAIDRSGKIPVEVAAAPNDAKITFKDKKTKAEYTAKDGTNYLPPGDYSITAAKDGFRSSQTEANATTKPRYTVIIEAAYIEQQTGKRPLILLDDVFGELDRHRQKRLMSEFVDNQIVMTSAGD
jgi:hypothetical protein